MEIATYASSYSSSNICNAKELSSLKIALFVTPEKVLPFDILIMPGLVEVLSCHGHGIAERFGMMNLQSAFLANPADFLISTLLVREMQFILSIPKVMRSKGMMYHLGYRNLQKK